MSCWAPNGIKDCALWQRGPDRLEGDSDSKGWFAIHLPDSNATENIWWLKSQDVSDSRDLYICMDMYIFVYSGHQCKPLWLHKFSSMQCFSESLRTLISGSPLSALNSRQGYKKQDMLLAHVAQRGLSKLDRTNGFIWSDDVNWVIQSKELQRVTFQSRPRQARSTWVSKLRQSTDKEMSTHGLRPQKERINASRVRTQDLLRSIPGIRESLPTNIISSPSILQSKFQGPESIWLQQFAIAPASQHPGILPQILGKHVAGSYLTTDPPWIHVRRYALGRKPRCQVAAGHFQSQRRIVEQGLGLERLKRASRGSCCMSLQVMFRNSGSLM